eukprot:TRINITY_DN816_c0_g1_i1.p2 TRINITY_DN816_c0_g1~~TRINITY_DN816_c0_g1_i1.p2  ORF type:complete len:188 (-),score=49.73 TRINITY_DN816_c0_g1_i1:1000-1563(-)
MEVLINNTAYSKVVLHCYKYPSQEVNGLFLGVKAEGEWIQITDAVPLFHGTTLAPMLEMALLVVEEYCESKALQIVGYYHANEREDNEPSALAKKIAAKIHSNVSIFSLFTIDNHLANPKLKKTCLKSFLKSGDQWKPNSSELQVNSAVFNNLVNLIEENKYLSLNDFDNHFSDPSNDFLNVDLVAS